jgi:exodeoxyribonuclease VII small subunit
MPEKKESAEPKGGEKPLSFEDAMARIEEITSRMEDHDMPLDELIVAYEEGLKLVKICGERLAHAEKRIQQITRNAAGEATGAAPVGDETGAAGALTGPAGALTAPSTATERSVTEKDAGSPGDQPTQPPGPRLF